MTATHLRLVLTLALVVFGASESRADESDTFVIAAASGYGVEDCLGDGGECGRVVADAWCEGHGRGAAIKFGRSSNDMGGTPNGSLGPQAYFITCGN